MPLIPSRRRRRRRSRRHSRTASPESRRSGWLLTLFKWGAAAGLAGAVLVAAGLGYLYYRIAPTLPDVQTLREVQLQLPLRVYTADGDLIAEYAEKRREPVLISQVPESLRQAIIASEDARFYKHPGVDYQGLARAALHLVRTGTKGPGGSTITMQVARNFFLSNERTYARKLTEIFLSFKIEHELSKDEILELYLNKIYLGNRSYGFAAAARVYYGKDISQLNLAEAAMLAGLPKAPSRFNPIVNPERALIRRNYVLRRLNELNKISDVTYQQTVALPVTAELHYAVPEVEADYVGEMARARVEQLFGDNWSTAGFNVFTTIRSTAQTAANRSLRGALYDYEMRHGYTGPVEQLDATTLANATALLEKLDSMRARGNLTPAAVIGVDEQSAQLVIADGSRFSLSLEDVAWARERLTVNRMGDEITAVNQVLAFGDVIHLSIDGEGQARFVQEPAVEGAFVAVAPETGAINALVGGFDFSRSKFNRVTQARRQPGSTFKPFIYSAALAAGDTPATIYNDAPVVFHDAALEGEWRPSNYSGRFFGPTRLREALVKSRNLVSVRVLREIGIPYAVDYATRFGFGRRHLPEDLSLALGSGAVTPIELAGAYSVFANGGYRVQPHFIQRIEDPRGKLLYASPKVVLCDDCNEGEVSPLQDEMEAEGSSAASTEPAGAPIIDENINEPEPVADLDIVNAPRVIDERNAYIMGSMMREVVRRGTARRAGEALERSDFAGKTGTTNNQLDAWFAGYNPDVVATAWIGSDGLDPLGRGEAGGVAALPMWTSFISSLLGELPETELTEPEGIESVRIDTKTGLPATGEGTMLEIFIAEDDETPVETEGGTVSVGAPREEPEEEEIDVRNIRERAREVEQLF